MFRQELYKLLIKKHILLLFVLFILLYGVFNMISPQPSDFTDKVQQETYESYMQQLTGPLTAEKEDFILSEQEKYSQSAKRVEQITNDYAAGKINDVEYDTLIEKESTYMINEPVFKQIERHYNYIKEDAEHRYFMDYTGWNLLMGKEAINYILLFFILISTTIVFNCEYESGMFIINSTCKYGKKRTILNKIIIGLLIALFSSLLFAGIDIIATSIQTPLIHGNYPIQSLPFFSNYLGELSLIKAYSIVVLLNIFGCCYASTLIMCLSVLSKSTMTTLFINLAINIVPYILSISSRVKYLLPLPGGLLAGTGYFVGSVKDVDSGKTVLPAISSLELIALVLTILIIMIISIIIMFRFYVPKRKVTK